MSIPRALIALALLLACSASVQAEQFVVVASNTALYQPKQILSGTEALTLPPNAKVTLISEHGRTITLEGPYYGIPGAPQSAESAEASRRSAPNADRSSEGISITAVWRSAKKRKASESEE